MHDTLNPLVWESDDKIKPDIRKALLLNAKRFIEFSGVEDLKFKDIILTGSIANFNYNENSDMDVHVVLDFKQISENKEFVGDYFKLKKALWAERLPIQIKGHDVEMYFQDSAEPHHSSGTYSLTKDEWITKPTKKIVNIDTANVQLKSADLMNAIEDLESNKNEDDFLKKHEGLKNKIKKLRQSGLDRAGEFSTENIAFKVLRNTGYLEKLMKMKNEYLTKELSLNEFLSEEPEVATDDIVADEDIPKEILARVPFFKEYENFSKEGDVKLQRIVYYEDVPIHDKEGNVTMFKQYNAISNFSHFINDMGMGRRKQYHFYLQNQIAFQPEGGWSEIKEKVYSVAMKMVNEKNSYLESVIVDVENGEKGLTKQKLDEVINNLNKSLFKFEEFTKKTNTPIFN